MKKNKKEIKEKKKQKKTENIIHVEEKVEIKRVHNVQIPDRVNIRCRECFIVDGYLPDEGKCKHCGSVIYRLDIY